MGQTNMDNNSVIHETKEKGTKKNKVVIEIVIYIILLFFAAFIVPKYILQRTIVKGNSMEPTLYNKENLWVEKISYHFDCLKRFDVILFYPNGKGTSDYYIKRIIGLPGERVQIIGETIYINGEPLEENYGKDPIIFAGIAENEIHLADDEYFVLGDNRTISLDSRYLSVGPVNKAKIEGKAFLRIWPFSKFGLID